MHLGICNYLLWFAAGGGKQERVKWNNDMEQNGNDFEVA